jgi:hypothetical protein
VPMPRAGNRCPPTTFVPRPMGSNTRVKDVVKEARAFDVAGGTLALLPYRARSGWRAG